MSYLKIFVFISSAGFSLGGGQANFLRQPPQQCSGHTINCRLMHSLEIRYDVLKSAHGIESKGKDLQNSVSASSEQAAFNVIDQLIRESQDLFLRKSKCSSYFILIPHFKRMRTIPKNCISTKFTMESIIKKT